MTLEQKYFENRYENSVHKNRMKPRNVDKKSKLEFYAFQKTVGGQIGVGCFAEDEVGVCVGGVLATSNPITNYSECGIPSLLS